MKTEEFNYNLPEELIAQKPCESRDHSRMMVVDRRHGSFECRHFYELPEFLEKDDLLVINNSKVIPAKLSGKKSTGTTIEMLLLEKAGSPVTWEVLLRPAKRVGVGTKIFFDDHSWAEITERISDKKWAVSFTRKPDLILFSKKFGSAPLSAIHKRKKGLIKTRRICRDTRPFTRKIPGRSRPPPPVCISLKELLRHCAGGERTSLR